MLENITFLAAPFAACLVLAGIFCYLGLHVVMRGVIFVDLALAQIAAMGATVALLFHHGHHGPSPYLFSLGFTFVGAFLFALSRFREERIPQEAIIGIVFVFCSALSILILDRAPHGHEAMNAMLVGSVLFVSWPTVLKLLLISTAVGALHYFLRRPFFAISEDAEKARRAGYNIKAWDFVFYVSFGLVITSAVQIAGVLMVFSYLVVPTVCAMLFATRTAPRLLLGWLAGLVASLLGILASAQWDLPTGASVVTAFGLVLIACLATYKLSKP